MQTKFKAIFNGISSIFAAIVIKIILFVLPIIWFIILVAINYDFYEALLITGVILSCIIGLQIVLSFILTIVCYLSPKLTLRIPDISAKVYKSLSGYNFVNVKTLREKRFEIPLFNNIYLDFKLTGDFKKHCTDFFIENYPVKYNTSSLKWWGKQSQESTDNWRAVWIFNKIPKTGELYAEFL